MASELPAENDPVCLSSFMCRSARPRNPSEEGAASATPKSSGDILHTTSFGAASADSESVRRSDSEVRRSFDTRSFISERVGIPISKRYNIDKREIGVGGYGKIYIAEDRMFKDRLVAIKKVAKVVETNEEDFRREVKILRDLDHPNICRLFETYDQDQYMCFVLEYCEGGDLFDCLSESDVGRLPEENVAAILKQAASALRYAHQSHGIAHRDLKPENICFCEKNSTTAHVKVIDWGLAKYFGVERMRTNVGTSTYSAPEVLDKKRGDIGYTSACDIWSLGVLTYVTLTGKPPFWGTPKEMLQRMKREHYPLHDGIWETVSDDAKHFIRSCLKRHPAERLPVDQILTHPWLSRHTTEMDPLVVERVLSNLEHFSHAPDFFSICVASVARQVDYSQLRDIHAVFCDLDLNGDGVLDIREVRAGFERVYGGSSPELADVDAMFSRLDLDDTGLITYTECCAAGLGKDSYLQEHLLWAAFKTFDIHDDGRISQGELLQVLRNADVSRECSLEVCKEVAAGVMQEFGGTDGCIHFEHWVNLMSEFAFRHETGSRRRSAGSRILSLPQTQRSTCFSGICACVVQ
eukprot:TRINITY_DN63106_c0_g1_i1.p1 TRINITY_DN63106_c0_g1~~TRINITY_DN63106_c0_g1_i1.p1  ORF type:complete len:591 (+),score=90.43 TRINITY_DN63106_c0_g1_i1:35-1774(+)